MADVALAPTFPAAELERLRAGAAHGAAAGARRPGRRWRRRRSRASSTATRIVTARAPPARRRHSTAFTPPQLAAFHAARYRPSNATLIVVGDVTAATVLPLLESAFGGWTARRAAARAPCPRRRSSRARQVTIVDMPGAEQSQIRIGTVGVARSTPDYFALQVLNTVLGGSFTSRLNQNLREDARLRVRRQLAVRHAPFAGPVRGRSRRADRQDVGVVDGDLQGARRDSRADRSRRARKGQELPVAGFPERRSRRSAISRRTSRSSRSMGCRSGITRTTPRTSMR